MDWAVWIGVGAAAVSAGAAVFTAWLAWLERRDGQAGASGVEQE
jgi:hypothetical protein